MATDLQELSNNIYSQGMGTKYYDYDSERCNMWNSWNVGKLNT